LKKGTKIEEAGVFRLHVNEGDPHIIIMLLGAGKVNTEK